MLIIIISNKIIICFLLFKVGAVLCAFDARFSLPKLVKAASYLEKKGCWFIATNCDVRFPTTNKNIVFPGMYCNFLYTLKC